MRQLDRFAQMSNALECGTIWKSWLENLEAWKITSTRLVENLTVLSSSDDSRDKKTALDSFLAVLRDSTELRNKLGPSFTRLLNDGILTALKRCRSNGVVSSVMKLGIINETKTDDVSPCAIVKVDGFSDKKNSFPECIAHLSAPVLTLVILNLSIV